MSPMKSILAIVLLATPLAGQEPGRIELQGGRPVAQALDQFERLSGIAIHYEDIRYEHPDDVEDVTDEVRNPEHVGPTTHRILVPKTRSFSTTFSVGDDGRLGDVLAVESALNGLLAANNAAAMPGRFRIDRYGDRDLFLLPTSVRGSDGSAKPYSAVLGTPISVVMRGMNGAEALALILKQVSQASGQQIKMGMVPMNGLAYTKVSMESEGRPAAYVLAELLGQLGGTFAIRMFYGPDVKYYALNVHRVVDSAKALEPPNPVPETPNPGSPALRDGPFFRRVQ